MGRAWGVKKKGGGVVYTTTVPKKKRRQSSETLDQRCVSRHIHNVKRRDTVSFGQRDESIEIALRLLR